MFFIPSVPGGATPIESYTSCHIDLVHGLLANKPEIVVMASGNPEHLFKILSETSTKFGGQLPTEPNILL